MKINLYKYLIFLIIIFTSLIFYLSIFGIETEKFNQQIKDRIYKKNPNLEIDLKKIKLTLDPFNFKINAKTIGPAIYFSKKSINLEYIKSQISLISILKNSFVSSNIEIGTRSILAKDVAKFMRVINNNPKLLILEKIISDGSVIVNLNINLDENGNVKSNYRLNGVLKNGSIKLFNKGNLKNINLNFDLKKNNLSFQKTNFTYKNINFNSELLKISKKQNKFLFNGFIENKNSILDHNILRFINFDLKKINIKNINFDSKNNFTFEIDKKLKFKNITLQSEININHLEYKADDYIYNFFPEINKIILLQDHKLKLNFNNNKFSINGDGKIKFKDKLEKIKYLIIKKKNDISISSDLKINSIIFKKFDFLNNFFPSVNEQLNLKDHILKIIYKNKSLSISGVGKVKIDNEFDNINYLISKKKGEVNFKLDLNLKETKFKIKYINYIKADKSPAQLKIQGKIKENKQLILNDLSMLENQNKIQITNLLLTKNNSIIKFDKLDFNYFDTEKKENKFLIKKKDINIYEITGQIFNANSLITSIIKDNNQKKQKSIFRNNIIINLNLDKVYIDELYYIKNLSGKLFFKDNKVIEAAISAAFKNNEKIKFTINSKSSGNKITTLNSTWAKPIVNRYKFIKGFEEGYLDFTSSKKDGISNSVLIIDNFKVKEVPALAKLLALASLQGIADLLTGEGIRFTDFEMKFSNKENLMTIEEIYAIGPSISILMEGYVQSKKLISLRGTLVPATTINRTISSIPLIGDLLVGKKVGEGVFGVSFKIKGPPKELKTSVNPVKTLTPRFITRTLEKIKKN